MDKNENENKKNKMKNETKSEEINIYLLIIASDYYGTYLPKEWYYQNLNLVKDFFFEKYNVHSKNITLLVGKNASKRNILDRWKSINKIENTFLIVYYLGDPFTNKNNELLYPFDYLLNGCINEDEIMEINKESKNNQTILFLDKNIKLTNFYHLDNSFLNLSAISSSAVSPQNKKITSFLSDKSSFDSNIVIIGCNYKKLNNYYQIFGEITLPIIKTLDEYEYIINLKQFVNNVNKILKMENCNLNVSVYSSIPLSNEYILFYNINSIQSQVIKQGMLNFFPLCIT